MPDDPVPGFREPREPLSDEPSDEAFLRRITVLSVDLGELGYPKLSGACSAAFVALQAEIALASQAPGAFQQCK